MVREGNGKQAIRFTGPAVMCIEGIAQARGAWRHALIAVGNSMQYWSGQTVFEQFLKIWTFVSAQCDVLSDIRSHFQRPIFPPAPAKAPPKPKLPLGSLGGQNRSSRLGFPPLPTIQLTALGSGSPHYITLLHYYITLRCHSSSGQSAESRHKPARNRSPKPDPGDQGMGKPG